MCLIGGEEIANPNPSPRRQMTVSDGQGLVVPPYGQLSTDGALWSAKIIRFQDSFPVHEAWGLVL